jgi:hypothetical protein
MTEDHAPFVVRASKQSFGRLSSLPTHICVDEFEPIGVLNVTLWWGGNGLKVQGDMVATSRRGEVGVLVFAEPEELSSAHRHRIELCSSEKYRLRKLVGLMESTSAESGIEMVCGTAAVITVVSGETPHTLFVRVAGLGSWGKSELPMSSYQRAAMPFD